MIAINGWLTVNNFVNSEKSNILRSMLVNAAEKCGISLTIKRTGELGVPIGGSFVGLPDFALFWDKDTHLAQRLEDSGLRLFNTARAIELCDNKVLTYMRLAQCGIPFPESYASPKAFSAINTDSSGFVANAAKRLGLPFIIKEAYGSFGQQVHLAHSLDEAYAVIRSLGGREFVMQRFVKESCGRDVRINVVGGRVIASIYRYNDNDFRSNISNGGKMKEYRVSEAQEKLAVDACRALGLDFGGVDVLFDGDVPTVCEVNSNPHFKSTYDCTGVDMSLYIMEYIKESL